MRLFSLWANKMSTDKPVGDRVKESVAILKKLTNDLGIPYESSGVQELKSHFDLYIKDGTCWTGTVNFGAYGRVAHVNLPKSAKRPIEVTLKMK